MTQYIGDKTLKNKRLYCVCYCINGLFDAIRQRLEISKKYRSKFPVLDQLLGGSEDMQGGFYPEDLWLLAGAQGIGKTSLALQMAHNMGSKGVLALFVCYEHTP